MDNSAVAVESTPWNASFRNWLTQNSPEDSLAFLGFGLSPGLDRGVQPNQGGVFEARPISP
jgi:hypothetical protein